MLNCSSCRRHIAAYLEGTLPNNERVEVSAHIQNCEECAKYCASERAMLFATRELQTVTPPADLRNRIRAAAYQEREAQRTAKPSWLSVLLAPQKRLVWAGGASVMAFGLLMLVSSQKPGEVLTAPQSDSVAAAETEQPKTTRVAVKPATKASGHAREADAPKMIAARPPIESSRARPVLERPEIRAREIKPSEPTKAPRLASRGAIIAESGTAMSAPAIEPVAKPIPVSRTDDSTRIATPAEAPREVPEALAAPVPAPVTANGSFMASAEWKGARSLAMAPPVAPNAPSALRAAAPETMAAMAAARTIRLKITPIRDVSNGQIRAMVPKSEDGKIGETNEVVWSGDATANAPIAIFWEPPVKAGRPNFSVTLTLEQLDKEGKATAVQTQVVAVGDAAPAK